MWDPHKFFCLSWYHHSKLKNFELEWWKQETAKWCFQRLRYETQWYCCKYSDSMGPICVVLLPLSDFFLSLSSPTFFFSFFHWFIFLSLFFLSFFLCLVLSFFLSLVQPSSAATSQWPRKGKPREPLSTAVFVEEKQSESLKIPRPMITTAGFWFCRRGWQNKHYCSDWVLLMGFIFILMNGFWFCRWLMNRFCWWLMGFIFNLMNGFWFYRWLMNGFCWWLLR